jgi:hypothetical protein
LERLCLFLFNLNAISSSATPSKLQNHGIKETANLFSSGAYLAVYILLRRARLKDNCGGRKGFSDLAKYKIPKLYLPSSVSQA